MNIKKLSSVIDLEKPIPQARLAALIGISQQGVSDLVNRGVLPRGGSAGVWLLAYTARLREQAAGRIGGGEGVHDLTEERARLAHHQANLAAMDEEVKRKNLIPVEVVTAEWCNQAANIRAKLLNLPGRGAVAVAGMGTVQEIEKELRTLVYDALRELAAGK